MSRLAVFIDLRVHKEAIPVALKIVVEISLFAIEESHPEIIIIDEPQPSAEEHRRAIIDRKLFLAVLAELFIRVRAQWL